MARTRQAARTESGQGRDHKRGQGSQATLKSLEEAGSVAQHTVLFMPDLLVIILSQLPHSTLVKAKRVNKTWANVFGHMEIQAALFQQPRPKESALYAEAHSDILKTIFPGFWPGTVNDKTKLIRDVLKKRLRSKQLTQKPTDESKGDGSGEKKPWPPHSQPWRQLLVCQPPVKVLELIQKVSCRGGPALEFRTTIDRPEGLRMGLLFDAIMHWHESEGSNCILLWNRRSGDLLDECDEYEDRRGFKKDGNQPCVTILGLSSVGCGQYGGLTYSRGSRQGIRIIRSGDEKVKYRMSKPKAMDSGATLYNMIHGNRRRRNSQENED